MCFMPSSPCLPEFQGSGELRTGRRWYEYIQSPVARKNNRLYSSGNLAWNEGLIVSRYYSQASSNVQGVVCLAAKNHINKKWSLGSLVYEDRMYALQTVCKFSRHCNLVSVWCIYFVQVQQVCLTLWCCLGHEGSMLEVLETSIY